LDAANIAAVTFTEIESVSNMTFGKIHSVQSSKVMNWEEFSLTLKRKNQSTQAGPKNITSRVTNTLKICPHCAAIYEPKKRYVGSYWGNSTTTAAIAYTIKNQCPNCYRKEKS
jgi:rRNA maturation protein Nop10